jgi:Uncharacterized protein involved in an early stage of isoprenoid biosynthesis
MKKFAVILAGCGRKDGSEINEAVTLLLALDQQGCAYQCFAPDILQHHVINHLTDEFVPNETRNVLVEAARIARGKILPLDKFNAEDFDALAFSGGYGVAKNLCDFAFAGENMEVIPEVAKAILDMHKLGKPIGAMCIAPVLIAKVIKGAYLTLGNEDDDAAEAARKMGANHVQTEHGDVVVDEVEKIFTTPCYMLDATISDVYDGAGNLVEAMLQELGEKEA